MNDKRKEYLKKWREDNKEHIKNYKKEYAKTHDNSFKKLQYKYKQLQQENKQLKEQIKEYQKSLDETMSEKVDIENNWNKLKEFIVKEYYMYLPLEASTKSITILRDKMKELEQGSDRDE